jgi:hypothetical protein
MALINCTMSYPSTPVLSYFNSLARAGIFAGLIVASAANARAQGCVAIKQMGDGAGACSAGMHEMMPESESKLARWDVAVSYQHFRSHRHFVGTNQQFQRRALNSEVVNVVEQIDTAINYHLNPSTSFTLGIPYFSASRTSLYEHDRVNRYQMDARGIGDVRLSMDRWIFNPHAETKGNVSFGLGIKMPTGNSNVKDYAHTASGPVLRNVDQSIQPGDGAWGYTFQMQAYRKLAERTNVYATGFYLVNPAETNGTRTTSSITSVTAYNSVADQYQARLGVSQLLMARYRLTASLGGRLEGVPALDLTGGDRGFRRPGYVVSVEPGISFSTGHDSFSLSVPVAVVRNRVRSYADRLGTGQGDAAFADFLISMTYAHHW